MLGIAVGGIKQAEALLADHFIDAAAQGTGPGRIDVGNDKIGVDGEDRRRNNIEVLDLLVGLLPLPCLIGDIEDELEGAGDVALGILDRRAGVLDRHDHAIARPGNGLFGHHGIGFHRPVAGAFFRLAMRGFEQIIAFAADNAVRAQTNNLGTGGINIGNGEIGVDGHDRRRNGIEVFDFGVGVVPLPGLLGDVENKLQAHP